MFKNNRNLAIIAVIALVNSLGYGIIIPILEAYASSLFCLICFYLSLNVLQKQMPKESAF